MAWYKITWFNNFIKWLKPSFEGADGKSSARALTNGQRNSSITFEPLFYSSRPYQYSAIGFALTNSTMERQQSHIVTFFNSLLGRQ